MSDHPSLPPFDRGALCGAPRLLRRWRLTAGAVCLALAAGCGHTEVNFSLNREGQKPAKPDDQKLRTLQDTAITEVLYTMFGTPDAPVAWGGEAVSGLNETKLRMAAGPADDPQGHGLFRKHCVHCHGVTGDGNGPTARFLNPYPRDFRRGIFKFKSTAPGEAMPTRDDLQRTIREGINGTAMPSFKVLLRPDEVEAVAEYVVYLSARGLVELELRNPENDQGLVDDYVKLDPEKPGAPPSLDTYKNQIIPNLLSDPELKVPFAFARWRKAEKQVLTPPPRDAATEKLIAQQNAEQLFLVKANCIKCHGPNALGDGGQLDFDNWNKPKADQLKANPNLTPALLAERFNLPLQRSQPRNLRLGIYRGGRRPVDIYRRIAVGINGTPMPAHAASSAADTKNLQPHEIWALVDYVRSLPYGEAGEQRTWVPGKGAQAEGP